MRNLAPELKWNEIALCMLASLLLLSPAGSNLILVFGGNYYPELGVIFIYLVSTAIYPGLGKKVLAVVRTPYVLLGFGFVFIAAFLGFVNNDVSPAEAYGISRSFMACCIGFSVFRVHSRSGSKKTLSVIFALATFTIIFSFLYNVAFLSAEPKRPYSLFAIVVISVFLTFRGSVFQKLIWMVFMFIISVHSGFRAYIGYSAVLALMMVFSTALDVIRIKSGRLVFSVSRLAQVATVSVVFIFGTPVFVAGAYQWIMQDESRYHQLIYKFEEQYGEYKDGNVDGKLDPRIDMNNFIFSSFLDFILPNGFYNRSDYSIHSVWGTERISFDASSPTRDGGFLFMSMSFGLLLSAPLMLFMYFKILVVCIKNGIRDAVVRILISAVLTGYYFTSGAMFTVIDMAFYFGFALAAVTSVRPLAHFGNLGMIKNNERHRLHLGQLRSHA